MKIKSEFPGEATCPNCHREFEPPKRHTFNVYEASSEDHLRKGSSGLWNIAGVTPMLVAESWEEDEGFVQAITLEDYEGPGFTIIEFADAEYMGKARIRVANRDAGDLKAPLGQLYVRNGNAGISYLTGGVFLLQVPLAEAVPDGDYGFNWDLECSRDGTGWKRVYEAEESKSWLNSWTPADDVMEYLPGQLRELSRGLVPPHAAAHYLN